METWKDIVGYEGMYRVSDMGRVRSIDRIDCAGRRLAGVVMRLQVTRGGYLFVTLSKDGKQAMYRVNRLVAAAFIENPFGLPHAANSDDDRQNNKADNLYWSSVRDNLMHNNRHINIGKKTWQQHRGRKGQ